MPNYNLYVGRSRYYDPTEFQTLREDLKNMTDQYNTTMAAYGEMSSKADLFEKLANDVKGKDSIAYQNYMNYANAIRQHTDLLATQGLTPSTMRNLVQAKNDYNRIIAPIEEAYNAREAEAKRQAEYMSKYPGAIFERDANKMGIDQWMKNPSYRAKSLDRETVANRAKERFAALQKKIQEFVSEHGHVDPSTMDANQLKQWVKTNIPYEYQALEKYGVSPDDVRELMLGNPRMQNSILQAIVNDTMGMYGVDTWNTDYDHYTDAQNQQNRFNIYNQVYNAIRGEAPNSVGQDKYDKETDSITWQKELGWARLAEERRQFNEKMAAAKAAAEKAETINTDDAAVEKPTMITGQHDHQTILSEAEALRAVNGGGFENVSLPNLQSAIEEVQKELGVEHLIYDESTLAKLRDKAKEIEDNDTHWWSAIGNTAAGVGKSAANLLLKLNSVGLITQGIGTALYANDSTRRTANAINGDPMGAGEYFFRSMIGTTPDDLINARQNYNNGMAYFRLSAAKNGLSRLDKIKNMSFETYKKEISKGAGYDKLSESELKNRYDALVKDAEKEYNEYNNIVNTQEAILKKNGVTKNAADELTEKLKDYGYTKQMEENGISPLFFINNLADGNLVEWSTNQSSVLNETNRKNLAESLSEMILVPGSENVNLYEFDENKGAMDQLTNKEYKQISGYDPTNNKAGQTPLITHDPRHRDLLICKYTDEDGIQHSYALKTADLHKHPGFDRMVRKALNEDADAYLDYTNPHRFFNMPIAKQDKYLKNLYKGMNEEQKATANRAMCAQWVMKCNPGFTDINAIDKEVEDMYANRPQEVYSIILKNAIKSEVNSRNHDMINSSVKDLLWGLGESNTTPDQKSLWFKYYGVGLD